MHAGPELDKAVAASVGWQHVLQPVGRHKNRRVWFRDGTKRQVAWRYSTNPTHIPEMLLWLNERDVHVELEQDCEHYRWVCEGWLGGTCYTDWQLRDCDTIQHALANLVVAAAARFATETA